MPLTMCVRVRGSGVRGVVRVVVEMDWFVNKFCFFGLCFGIVACGDVLMGGFSRQCAICI